MLAPYKGRIYDPACGSGGMFVQSESSSSRTAASSATSASTARSNATTRRLAVMNLAIRGIEADFRPRTRRHLPPRPAPDLRADYVSPTRRSTTRLVPKTTTCAGNTACRPRATPTSPGCSTSSTTWRRGMAGFVLANGSMSSNQSGEGDIRKAIIEADLVDCMVALPASSSTARRFRSACGSSPRTRAPTPSAASATAAGRALFIDARKMGTLIDRVHRELTDADLAKITGTTTPGARVAATPTSPASANRRPTPKSRPRSRADAGPLRRRRGVEDDGEPFEEKMPRLVAEPHAQFAESAKLEQTIKANLKGLGYGW